MISITPAALSKIDQLKAAEGLGPEHFIRVSVVGGGCSGLSYNLDFDDEVKTGDQEFVSEGAKIVCDMKSFLYLCGTELDFSDGLNGRGFNFINPNATRTCGCGESFAV
ncbi:MAG: iron-sulfur cluster assembly accessory protein [Bacteroidetes bacterium]|nr:iron-sulfur cluster assembly accessory protein [Bacteroidota bacterium]